MQVKELRQRTRDEREKKVYINNLKKIYKIIKPYKIKLLKHREAMQKR